MPPSDDGAISRHQDVANYLKALYDYNIAKSTPVTVESDQVIAGMPEAPPGLSDMLVVECGRIASGLAEALRNEGDYSTCTLHALTQHHGRPVILPWDFDRYSEKVIRVRGMSDSFENPLMTRYPPIRGASAVLKREEEGLPLPIIRHNCIVRDPAGRVILWCLPGLLSPYFQVFIMARFCIHQYLTSATGAH